MDQPIQSCLIWPVQMMVKYVLLLKSILDCINVSNEDSNMAAQKLKEAISVMEQVPTKANDAMHLGTVTNYNDMDHYFDPLSISFNMGGHQY